MSGLFHRKTGEPPHTAKNNQFFQENINCSSLFAHRALTGWNLDDRGTWACPPNTNLDRCVRCCCPLIIVVGCDKKMAIELRAQDGLKLVLFTMISLLFLLTHILTITQRNCLNYICNRRYIYRSGREGSHIPNPNGSSIGDFFFRYHNSQLRYLCQSSGLFVIHVLWKPD